MSLLILAILSSQVLYKRQSCLSSIIVPQNQMSVTSIWEDKSAFKVKWVILFGLFITLCEGRKEGKQGGWSNVPHKGRQVSHANSLPFLEHQRSHCYQVLLWPQQKTPNRRVEGYFHGRTKAACPHTQEPRERTRPANTCWMLERWALHHTWRRLRPCGGLCWYLQPLGLQGFAVEFAMSWLSYFLPLAPFH